MGLIANKLDKVFLKTIMPLNHEISIDLTLCMATVKELSPAFTYIHLHERFDAWPVLFDIIR